MTQSSSRRIMRGVAVAAIGGLTVLTLSGCLSMTANLSISPDAKTTGTFAIGLQKQAAGMLGMKDLDTFKSGITSPDLSEGSSGLLSGDECAASETDIEFIYTCTLRGDEPASGDIPWTVTKSGDVITFHMVNKASDTSDNELLQGGSLGDLTVDVTFPGTITSVTGDKVTKTSDTTITIKAPMSDPVDVTVTSEASTASSSSKVILIIGIIVLAIVVIALIAFFAMRRKDGGEPAAVSIAATDPAPVDHAPVIVAVEETLAEAPEEPKPDLS